MEEIKENPLGNAADLLAWFNLLYNQMSKGLNCFSKAVFHTLVLAKKNSQTDSERSVDSVICEILKG